jgi:hypothetical protein
MFVVYLTTFPGDDCTPYNYWAVAKNEFEMMRKETVAAYVS